MTIFMSWNSVKQYGWCSSLCRELLSLDQGGLANAPKLESFGVPWERQSSLSTGWLFQVRRRKTHNNVTLDNSSWRPGQVQCGLLVSLQHRACHLGSSICPQRSALVENT